MPLTTTHFHSNAPFALNAALSQLVPFATDDDGCNFESVGGMTLPPSASLDSANFSPDMSSVHSPHVSFSDVAFFREVSSIFERQMHLGIPQHPPGSVPNPYQQRSTRTFTFELGPISPALPHTQSMGTPTTFTSGSFTDSPSLFPSVPVSSSGPLISAQMNMMNGCPTSPILMPSTSATWGRRSPSPAPHYLPSLSQNGIQSSPAIQNTTPPPIGRTVFIPAPTSAPTPPPPAIGEGEDDGYRENERNIGVANYANSNQYRPSAALRSLSPGTRPLTSGVAPRVPRGWGTRGEAEQQVNNAVPLPMVRSEVGMDNNRYSSNDSEVISVRNEGPRRASWSAGMMRPGMLAQLGLYDSSVLDDPTEMQGRGAWDHARVGDAAGVLAAAPLSPNGQALGSARGYAQSQQNVQNPLQALNQSNHTQPNGNTQNQNQNQSQPAITTRVRTYYRYVDKNGNPLSDVMQEKPQPGDQTAAAAAAAMAVVRTPRSNDGPKWGDVSSVGGASGIGAVAAVGRSRSPAPPQFIRSPLKPPPSYEESGMLSSRGPSPAIQRVQAPDAGHQPHRALSPGPAIAQPGTRGSLAEAVPRPQPRVAVVRRVNTNA